MSLFLSFPNHQFMSWTGVFSCIPKQRYVNRFLLYLLLSRSFLSFEWIADNVFESIIGFRGSDSGRHSLYDCTDISSDPLSLFFMQILSSFHVNPGNDLSLSPRHFPSFSRGKNKSKRHLDPPERLPPAMRLTIIAFINFTSPHVGSNLLQSHCRSTIC